ncbi:DUF4350 domain-containing protein [Microbacterium fluvii]
MQGWLALGAALVVVGIAGAVLAGIGGWTQRDALDPESPAPEGTMALARILADRGVEVIVARDRDEALRALATAGTTLALPDAPLLSDAAVVAMAAAADDVVLLDPRSRTLRLLVDGSSPAGIAPEATIAPACDLPEAVRSGSIMPVAVFTAGEGVTACYPAGAGSALLVADEGERRTAAVDATELFTNAHLADDGNAALAINLLGRHDRLVWYVPGDTDLTDADPSLGELTPVWVSPSIVLLLCAAVAAALWRGRRFGPLVAERLPVTVRAAETVEGRARLYARARDTRHAAAQLRHASVVRLARLVGLGAGARPGDVADAVAARIARDPAEVRSILIDHQPDTDAQLVALYERLRDLEGAAHAALHPEGNPDDRDR